MENKDNYDITRLGNNLNILIHEFKNYDPDKSTFSSREYIMDRITETRIELRKKKNKVKKKELKNNKKNNSSN